MDPSRTSPRRRQHAADEYACSPLSSLSPPPPVPPTTMTKASSSTSDPSSKHLWYNGVRGPTTPSHANNVRHRLPWAVWPRFESMVLRVSIVPVSKPGEQSRSWQFIGPCSYSIGRSLSNHFLLVTGQIIFQRCSKAGCPQISSSLQYSAMSVHLGNSIGAAFIGMVFAAVIQGVSCAQAFYYFTHQNDTWHIKLLVTCVTILDAVRQALITHGVYTYTITYWGNLQLLQSILWSSTASVIVTGVTTLIVQSFFTLRIWRLSGRNIYISGICAILVVGAFVSLMVSVARTLRIKTVTDLGNMRGQTIACNVLGAAADLLIAAALCILLNLSRTGFHKSDAIINKLIIYSVNTGLVTSLCALASLISILVSTKTYIYVLFFNCLGPLYTNSILATLNGRNILRGLSNQPIGRSAFSLPDFDTNGSTEAQCQVISIKVDTTTQDDSPGLIA